MLALILAVAASAGTLILGRESPVALRSILGLAAAGQLFAILGAFGLLRPWAFVVFLAVALAGARGVPWKWIGIGVAAALPLILLAMYPPLAFDETLYHTPLVRAIAQLGAINFMPTIRFPVFPELHELLCVGPFLALGDSAPHLVSLAEVMLLVALLVASESGGHAAALLPAALFIGSPIVVYLATINYVDVALTLFVAAGFYCLARRRMTASGFLLGTACCVKYLGGYFAVAGLAYIVFFGEDRRRDIVRYLAAFAVALLPMYGRIVYLTGNPLYPFVPGKHLIAASGAWRVFWDITFARNRLGYEPPYTPLFALSVLVVLIAAFRDRRAAFLAALVAGYVGLFMFMPRDSRYLLPLVPLVSVVAARHVPKRFALAVAIVAIVPAAAYAGYRLAKLGLPAVTAAQRREFLERHVPEYRALEHRGAGRIYVCGAEQLNDYAAFDLLGDSIGEFPYDTILGNGRMKENFQRLGVRYFLVSHAQCWPGYKTLAKEPDFELVYTDDAATLWRLRDRSAMNSR